jgi:hypothetical protein
MDRPAAAQLLHGGRHVRVGPGRPRRCAAHRPRSFRPVTPLLAEHAPASPSAAAGFGFASWLRRVGRVGGLEQVIFKQDDECDHWFVLTRGVVAVYVVRTPSAPLSTAEGSEGVPETNGKQRKNIKIHDPRRRIRRSAASAPQRTVRADARARPPPPAWERSQLRGAAAGVAQRGFRAAALGATPWGNPAWGNPAWGSPAWGSPAWGDPAWPERSVCAQ